MYDGIFFINHALNVNQLSVFNNQQRYEQTLETLKSIDDKCPNNLKIIFDNSPNQINDSYLKVIGEWNNTWFLDMGKHEYVSLYSINGHRSIAETYSFMGMLEWFKQQDFVSRRIYKLSGRYKLNDNFVLDDPSYKNAFVFAEALTSWMDDNIKRTVEVDRLYRLRLWHMDYNLLDTFQKELPQIFNDCGQYGIDVEHSYYKHLNKYNVVEVPKIGVSGYIAPSGEYINE